ncbi:M20/M25/M40 family metallo-hydrolase [Sciscionella marina]|uniref:M20/M25/M40 family metallo-hydrolase n=1 Tax=Sciscionella marina TaxID=508770 RepID=UPI00035E508C|nr:M20/M25/M40 family metallo-hydrolase [Sciscionella marina]
MSATRSEITDDIRSWLRARRTELHTAVGDAVAIRSFPGTVAQNAVQDLVQEIAGTVTGSAVDRWRPDWAAVERLRAPVDAQQLWTPLIERDADYADVLPELECLAIRHGDTEGAHLILNGHVDVVPADGQPWSTEPFTPVERDGWLHGRGSMDMKGGLIAAAFAYRYLAGHWSWPGKVSLCSVVEEESGGNGTLACLQRGHCGDAVVFTEPTDLRVIHRHVGIQAFSVTITGRAGGMLRRSWADGVIPPLGRVLTALTELEHRRTATAHAEGGYDPDDLPGFVNVGFVSSGEWLATRPGSATMRGLMGVLPGETQQQAAQAITTAIEEAVGDDEAKVDVVIPPGGHRGAELPVGDELVDSFRWSQGVNAPGAPSRAGTMVCDAKIVHGGGWAPAIVLGPRGEGLHSADERVELASIEECVIRLVTGTASWFSR